MTHDNTAFSEWYHYLLLALWLIILLAGLKFYPKLDQRFQLKKGFKSKGKAAAGLLTFSFVLGFVLLMFRVFAHNARIGNSSEIFAYGLIILLLLGNAYYCFQNYVMPGSVFRLILLSILIPVYFFTGLMSGLFVMAIISVIVIIYFLIRFKNILTIK